MAVRRRAASHRGGRVDGRPREGRRSSLSGHRHDRPAPAAAQHPTGAYADVLPVRAPLYDRRTGRSGWEAPIPAAAPRRPPDDHRTTGQVHERTKMTVGPGTWSRGPPPQLRTRRHPCPLRRHEQGRQDVECRRRAASRGPRAVHRSSHVDVLVPQLTGCGVRGRPPGSVVVRTALPYRLLYPEVMHRPVRLRSAGPTRAGSR